MSQNFRKSVYQTLEITIKGREGISLYINIFLIAIIALNSIAIILHTVPDYKKSYENIFFYFELFSVFIFTIEYVFRVWSCVENEKYKDPFWGRLKFMFTAWEVIDLLAILPFYMSLFSTDLGLFRVLRIFRIIRLFRISKYFQALKVIQRVIQDKREELVLSMAFIFFLLLTSSSVVYYVEHDVQPDKFKSIPDAMWWGVNAMTTVGYGDLHPITPFGKFLGGVIAVLGVTIFALPTGILASGFAEQIREPHKRNKHCPHCGEEIG
jgi:voltage-gated potassium channel